MTLLSMIVQNYSHPSINVSKNKPENVTVLPVATERVFIFLSAMSACLIIIGIFCSIFILFTVRNSKLLTASSALIGNLCVCSLLYSTLVLPVHIMTLLARSSVVGDNSFICQSVSFLHVTLNMASANAHVVIALHRFLLLYLSGRFIIIRTARFAIGLAVVAWVPSILTNIFPVLGMGSRHGFDRRLFRCTYGPPAQRAYALYSRLMLGVVPLIVMIALYGLIYWLRMRSQRRLAVKQTVKPTAVAGGKKPTRLRTLRRDFQATQICCIACVGFAVFYLPNAVLGLLSYYQMVTSPMLALVCNQIQIFGLSTNPLLYALFSRDLRISMTECLRRCKLPVMEKFSSTSMSVNSGVTGQPETLAISRLFMEKNNVQQERTVSTPC